MENEMKMFSFLTALLLWISALSFLFTYSENQYSGFSKPHCISQHSKIAIWEDGPYCAPNGFLYERSTRKLDNGTTYYNEFVIFDDDYNMVKCNQGEENES
jgi:hypothetical protein